MLPHLLQMVMQARIVALCSFASVSYAEVLKRYECSLTQAQPWLGNLRVDQITRRIRKPSLIARPPWG